MRMMILIPHVATELVGLKMIFILPLNIIEENFIFFLSPWIMRTIMHVIERNFLEGSCLHLLLVLSLVGQSFIQHVELTILWFNLKFIIFWSRLRPFKLIMTVILIKFMWRIQLLNQLNLVKLISHILIWILSRRFNLFEFYRFDFIDLVEIFIIVIKLSLIEFWFFQERNHIYTCLSISPFLFQRAMLRFILSKHKFSFWLHFFLLNETVILLCENWILISSHLIGNIIVDKMDFSFTSWLIFHSKSHIIYNFVHVIIVHAVDRTVLFLHFWIGIFERILNKWVLMYW